MPAYIQYNLYLWVVYRYWWFTDSGSVEREKIAFAVDGILEGPLLGKAVTIIQNAGPEAGACGFVEAWFQGPVSVGGRGGKGKGTHTTLCMALGKGFSHILSPAMCAHPSSRCTCDSHRDHRMNSSTAAPHMLQQMCVVVCVSPVSLATADACPDHAPLVDPSFGASQVFVYHGAAVGQWRTFMGNEYFGELAEKYGFTAEEFIATWNGIAGVQVGVLRVGV